MRYKVLVDDAWKRDIIKKISRELDAHRLEEGLSSNHELAIQNDFFSSLNLSGFRVSAIGRRPLVRDEQ
jgi:hypothetical protein